MLKSFLIFYNLLLQLMFIQYILLIKSDSKVIYKSESEWALLVRYVYTYEEFVIVTKAPQCNSNRTGHIQQKNNIQIFK